jgi:hypothetical protein
MQIRSEYPDAFQYHVVRTVSEVWQPELPAQIQRPVGTLRTAFGYAEIAQRSQSTLHNRPVWRGVNPASIASTLACRGAAP